jgi:hypothetical protein
MDSQRSSDIAQDYFIVLESQVHIQCDFLQLFNTAFLPFPEGDRFVFFELKKNLGSFLSVAISGEVGFKTYSMSSKFPSKVLHFMT